MQKKDNELLYGLVKVFLMNSKEVREIVKSWKTMEKYWRKFDLSQTNQLRNHCNQTPTYVRKYFPS